MTGGPPDADRLARTVGAGLDGHVVAIDGLTRLTGGSSREIWAFCVRIDGGEDLDLVLRRDAPGEERGDELLLEVAVMEAARGAGVPVPKLYGDSASARDLGGIVMERITAETDPRRILTDEALGGARRGLARECGEALGRLHSLDVHAVAKLPFVDRLAEYRRELDRLDTARPVLELSYDWLMSNRPAPRPPVVVHGDFRLGNLAVGTDGVAAVFDWESAHVGDRLEDLGWIAVKTWRFRGDGIIGGFGDADDFLEAYAAVTGHGIERSEFDWALHLNTWIWAVGCLQQADRHLSGSQRSVDLAMVGRRVVEVEADLLELMS